MRSVVDIDDLNNFKTLHTYSHDITAMNNMIDGNILVYTGVSSAPS